MRILLSHCMHADPELEAGVAADRAEIVVQRGLPGAYEPVAETLRAAIDGIVHYPGNTEVDGGPDAYPQVRALLRSGVGFDGLDIEAWGRRGVAVFNVPDYGTSEVADHALALMLTLTRGIATYHEAMRADAAGRWYEVAVPCVKRLRGAVFGIVGLGRIGLAAAMRARGFGMRIAFYDPYLASGMEIAVGAERCTSLAELFAMSDVVSLHLPANRETRNMIGAEILRAAKPGLVLVNTARGTIVDLEALYDALKGGRIAGAALDVLPEEPPRGRNRLLEAFANREPWLDGRLTLSPHAAFYSPDALRDMRVKGVETVIRHLATGDLTNCVNREYLVRRE